MSSHNTTASGKVGWQFRILFADGRRGGWSHVLELPRTIDTGQRYWTSLEDKFEVREVFAGEVIAGVPPGCMRRENGEQPCSTDCGMWQCKRRTDGVGDKHGD